MTVSGRLHDVAGGAAADAGHAVMMMGRKMPMRHDFADGESARFCLHGGEMHLRASYSSAYALASDDDDATATRDDTRLWASTFIVRLRLDYDASLILARATILPRSLQPPLAGLRYTPAAHFALYHLSSKVVITMLFYRAPFSPTSRN